METKDLILRNWQDSDAKALYEMCLDETLRKSGIDFYNSITDSRNTIQCWKNDKGFKVIADKRNDNFIGFIIRKRRVENIARQHCNKIYLDVCLNSDYGPAQRFYIKRGYIPDGKGVYYKEKICEADVACRNDDELTLCLVKEL